MDYDDYAELRRRAERRLTVIPAWPFVAFQAAACAAMLIRDPFDRGIPFLAGIGAFGLLVIAAVIYVTRTAANRRLRRTVIDETLRDAVEMGWPLEAPSARELRLSAALLDDDLETRADSGRVILWSMGGAWLLWIVLYFATGAYSYGTGLVAVAGSFVLWLAGLGGLSFFQQRRRRAADKRVRGALERATVWSGHKTKRTLEAPWWTDDDDVEKPKRLVMEEEELLRAADDGELPDDFDRLRRRPG